MARKKRATKIVGRRGDGASHHAVTPDGKLIARVSSTCVIKESE